MVIKEIKYSPRELIFKVPFSTSQKVYTQKNILFVQLFDEHKNFGLGECSPLPEIGTEKFEEAEHELIALKENIFFPEYKGNLSEYIHAVDERLSEYNRFPALRFALEQSLFNLLSKTGTNVYRNIQQGPVESRINVNSVIGFENKDEILQNIKSQCEAGYKTVKLKCGRKDFKDDYEIVKSIRDKFGDNINIRIDVNGKWNLEEAVEYLNHLEKFNLQYAEQPVKKNEEIIELSKSVHMNIASDESVKSPDDAVYLFNNGLKIIILKPVAAGGILNSLKIINEAFKHGANIIISSSFESEVGKSVLVYLASLTGHRLAHGLGVGSLYKESLFEDLLPIENGGINYNADNFPPEYNLK